MKIGRGEGGCVSAAILDAKTGEGTSPGSYVNDVYYTYMHALLTV